ncbi:hypothetical protein [Ralstonia sp. A12]|nr:hypothetical protein [Ralstonia sp. A12]
MRKTSQPPGGLRELADNVTARRRTKSAASFTDPQFVVDRLDFGGQQR